MRLELSSTITELTVKMTRPIYNMSALTPDEKRVNSIAKFFGNWSLWILLVALIILIITYIFIITSADGKMGSTIGGIFIIVSWMFIAGAIYCACIYQGLNIDRVFGDLNCR